VDYFVRPLESGHSDVLLTRYHCPIPYLLVRQGHPDCRTKDPTAPMFAPGRRIHFRGASFESAPVPVTPLNTSTGLIGIRGFIDQSRWNFTVCGFFDVPLWQLTFLLLLRSNHPQSARNFSKFSCVLLIRC
jgi:hypothetical protein